MRNNPDQLELFPETIPAVKPKKQRLVAKHAKKRKESKATKDEYVGTDDFDNMDVRTELQSMFGNRNFLDISDNF